MPAGASPATICLENMRSAALCTAAPAAARRARVLSRSTPRRLASASAPSFALHLRFSGEIWDFFKEEVLDYVETETG